VKVIVIRQPWAHLIVTGVKRIENRTWRTNHRGPILISAAARAPGERELQAIEARHDVELPRNLPTGGIVGIADIIDVVVESRDPYWVGPIGFVLDNASHLQFRPLKGQLGIFDIVPPYWHLRRS
jgi:hypothetical protein